MQRKRLENTPVSVDAAYRVLLAIYNKHRRRYKANPDSKQACCMWSTSRLPDVLTATPPLCDIEEAFDISIDEDNALKIYDMDLDEAARTISDMVKANAHQEGYMAEYGEWTQKGATLSDATAKAEYGVDYAFSVKGIKVGKLEYREGAVWGNPFLRVLRSQLEKYITKQLGAKHLVKVKAEAELRKIKKEMSVIKKKLNALQLRKAALENAISKG